MQDKNKWDKLSGQIPDFKNVVNIGGGGWDFLTLHQPTKDEASWFWEDMENGYSDKKHHDVEHFPFSRFSSQYLKGYKYVVFYVVYAKDTAVLPPAQYNCGN